MYIIYIYVYIYNNIYIYIIICVCMNVHIYIYMTRVDLSFMTCSSEIHRHIKKSTGHVKMKKLKLKK